MKKLVSLILCVCMALSLCACAELDAIRNTELPPLPTPDAPETPEVTEAPKEESAPALAQSTPESQTPAAAEAYGAALGDRVIIYTKKTQENIDAPDGSIILIFSYVTPTVRIDERPQAAEAINEQLGLLDELYISGSDDEIGKNQLLENALDNFTYVHETGAELNTQFSSARTVKSMRADGSVISFRYWTSVYTGKDNGSYGYLGLNFDGETGEKLTLDALASDPAALKKALTEGVIASAHAQGELYSAIAANDTDADSALGAIVRDGNWYFSGEGIVFFPAFGELLPEGEGLPMFIVPYAALAGVMEERFLPVRREGEAALELVKLDDVEDGTVLSIDRLALSEGEEMYLKVSGTAYDVTVSSFYVLEQEQEDDRFFESDRHWCASFMTDCALQLCTLVPNGMPNLMVSYTDADYVPHRLFVSQNGADGGVALVDDTIQAVG